MKKLILIDGSNLMFRAYYATAYSGRLMKNSKGQYTNAVYGLINMLNVILKEDFTHALVAFDKGKATFRHKEYEAYKAKRKPMPDEFRDQLELIKQTPEKLGIQVYESEALEADDIIGSLAYTYYDDFDEIEIISNDKDLFQLLNHKVYMRLSKRGLEPDEKYTETTLKETMNITPAQIPDLKGLMGDSSDNLPGIPGVGEKTALKLLHEYGNIETLLKNLNELKGKQKEKIENHGKDALKWRRLATLKTDAEFSFGLNELEYKGYDLETLTRFYELMEFHSLIKRLDKKTAPVSTAENTYEILKTDQAIKTKLKSPSVIVLESFGENYHFSKNLGFAFLNESTKAFIPLDVAKKSESFQSYLADQSEEKYTFDYKRLLVCANRENLAVNGVSFDLLLAAYLLNPSNTKEDFKVIVSNFDYDDVAYLEDIYGKGTKTAVPDINTYSKYAIDKAQAIFELKDDLLASIKSYNQLTLLNEIEHPLSEILANMEELGVLIDKKALNEFSDELDLEIADLTKKIHDEAGVTFNIGSPKQLGEILFETLNLPVYKRSKTGYSTNIDVLKKLQGQHPIIDYIIEYRSVSKLKNAYVNSMFEAVHEDGKIHTIYKQAFTQTGRLSSIEPNLQTIPIRSKRGRALRKVFVPNDHSVLMAADYSQIELRVLAHMAEEKTLIKAFKDGQDIHTITGKEILEKDEITSDERRIAKAVNFGIIYGQSAWGLSEEIGISQQEAKTFIERYYQKFNGIKAFMDKVVDFAKETGYVDTLYHRRRYIPELNSRIHAQRQFGKRTAMNAPLQGSAADIIKIAMVEIQKAMKQANMKSNMILQIHDELVFDVLKEEQAQMESLIQETMEKCVDLLIPLKVSLASGKNLDEAK